MSGVRGDCGECGLNEPGEAGEAGENGDEGEDDADSGCLLSASNSHIFGLLSAVAATTDAVPGSCFTIRSRVGVGVLVKLACVPSAARSLTIDGGSGACLLPNASGFEILSSSSLRSKLSTSGDVLTTRDSTLYLSLCGYNAND